MPSSSTSTPIYCGSENRRNLVRATLNGDGVPTLNGIDYLEIANTEQTEIAVRFIHPLPGEADGVPEGQPAFAPDNLRIEGGDRIRNIAITAVAVSGDLLTVTVDRPGDFSTYTLRLVAGPTAESAPPGFDPQLSRIRFSFKADCPSDFDCRSEAACPPEELQSPKIDYLARDYQSFRRVLLDRMRMLMPNWVETSPADFPIALAELLAYVGDHIAYQQDFIATEAYPGTAHHRISLKRHARLRDYWVHEGCNARTWIQMQVQPGGAADGLTIEAGQAFFAGLRDQLALAQRGDFGSLHPGRSVIFESMEPLQVRAAHNRFSLYTWSDDECALCAGATSATLLRPNGSALQPGHVLIFEETRAPDAPAESRLQGRPDRRWPVRLTAAEETMDPLTGVELYAIQWHPADALPFSLVLSRRVNGILIEDITVAFGNACLADHGLTVEDNPRDPSLSPRQATLDTSGPRYYPRLSEAGLTHRTPLENPEAQPAAACMLQSPAAARPQVWLDSEGERWHAVPDLLSSDQNAADFVVEIDNQRRAHLRFGDGEHGRQPALGQTFSAVFRAGNGARGNIGADTAFTILRSGGGFQRIRNPIAAAGGTDPESIESVRQFAPVAFRVQERAVTLEDYEEVALRHQGVQQARAEFRWMASWYTVAIAIDRAGGLPIDDDFRAELLAHMNHYRMAGYDLEITEPNYVPLDIRLFVCLKRGASRTQAHRELQERLGSGPLGLFHPDRLSFGQRIYASALIERASAVAGVDHVALTRFKRFWSPAAGELDDGYLEVAVNELPLLANNPSVPERGKIEFDIQGGS